MDYVYDVPVFKMIDRVEQFLRQNPRSNARQIMEALDLSQRAVSTCLKRLRFTGRAKRLPKTDSERRVRWEIGADPSFKPYVKDAFKRIMVSEWEPCTVRDPLLWLSYGVNPQPVQESLL